MLTVVTLLASAAGLSALTKFGSTHVLLSHGTYLVHTNTHALSFIATRCHVHTHSPGRQCKCSLPLSWMVIPMVPPVLITRTLASSDGDLTDTTDSTELQLDNFLLRHGCTWPLRVGEKSLPSASSSLGCDNARAREVRLLKLESAMMTQRDGKRTEPLWRPSRDASLWSLWFSSCVSGLRHGTLSVV